ncbi:MAG: magnesium transporter [Elusimicrobiota bacterium]
MRNIALYIPEIKNSLKQKNYDELHEILDHIESVDLVDGWEEFSERERLGLFNILSFERKVEIFERLSFEDQKEIIEGLTSQPLAKILNEMASDERVDLFDRLSNEEVNKLFSLMKEQEVDDVKELLEYDEQSAGGKMTTEYVTVNPEMTAREALVDLQKKVNSKKVKKVYAAYEIDKQGNLIGVISLQKLISSNPEEKIENLAKPIENIKVNVNQDQEEVARLFTHYDLLSAPVVDNDGKLRGVITIDDIVDVIHQEATEDIAKMAGTESEELLSKSVFKIFKIRWPWLFASWIGGLVALSIIGLYEDTMMQVIAVAAFIPVIMGMGGNIGVQSSTIVVRGLALGKVDLSKIKSTVLKEIKVGLALGISYGLLLGIIAHFKYGKAQKIAPISIVAGAGICLSMTIAATLGAVLPLIFKKLNIDPAVATGPIVTTTIDIVGLSIYFALAAIILV